MKRALIIGAGISGLGAALHLRAAGFEVTVLEALAHLGGKMHRIEQDGYRFDAGPTLLTQPERLHALYHLFEEECDLKIHLVDPSLAYHWPDQTVTTPLQRDALVAQLAQLGAEPARIHAYLDAIAQQYRTVGAAFVDADVTRPSFWLHPRTLLQLSGSLSQLGRSFHAYNAAWFPDTPRLVQLLDRFATYAGSDPWQAPAFLTSIVDVELRQGAFYPAGGMGSVPEHLVALGRRHGVQYRNGAAVTGLQVDQGRIRAVQVGAEALPCDVVISAIDPQHLAPMLDRAPSRAPRATSALLWFLGVDAKTRLLQHNVFFSADYQTEFRQLNQGTITADPTVYLSISSLQDPEHAPPGKQNWFVMINTPADTGQDWPALQRQQREHVFNKLQTALGPIVVHTERAYTPLDIQATSGAWRGSIYGPSSNGLFALFAKQAAQDVSIRNLFHCGGSSHPGGGVPMCLSSAAIAAGYAIRAS